MTRQERFDAISDWFERNVPDPQPELHYDNPFQLLCAVMLSAQCTDRRVNMVTPSLFERWSDAQSLSKATPEEVARVISSISYPNSKAAHLCAMAAKLVSEFGGKVPQSVEELETLPGVGRKTASVVSSVAFGGNRIAVDTHVLRVSHRLGLSDAATPEKTQDELERGFRDDLHNRAHHWLLLHGRYVCTARTPHCGECGLTQWCRFFKEQSSR